MGQGVDREASRLLDEELGIVPGPALRELERRILLQDPELGTPRPPPRASRLRSTRARLGLAFAGLALCLLGVLALVAMRGDDTPAVDRVLPNVSLEGRGDTVEVEPEREKVPA